VTRFAHRLGGWGFPPPQGPSLGSRLCCPGASSLLGPIRPTRRHTAISPSRLIRSAFAVRERLGDPRVVPGFRCSFLPDMPPSMTPGSSDIGCVQYCLDADTGLRQDLNGSALPTIPQSASRGARNFGASCFAFAAACQVARPPLADLTSHRWPPGAYTSRLPAAWSASPPLDIATTATGLLCRWDFHPLE